MFIQTRRLYLNLFLTSVNYFIRRAIVSKIYPFNKIKKKKKKRDLKISIRNFHGQKNFHVQNLLKVCANVRAVKISLSKKEKEKEEEEKGGRRRRRVEEG